MMCFLASSLIESGLLVFIGGGGRKRVGMALGKSLFCFILCFMGLEEKKEVSVK